MEEDVPKMSLSRIVKLRAKLGEIATPSIGAVLKGAGFAAFCRALARPLKAPPEAIHQTLAELHDKKLRAEDVKKFCRRLAGNYERLRGGQAVPAWTESSPPEWSIVQIVHSSRFSFRTSSSAPIENRVRIALLVLSGSPAGLVVTENWSISKAMFLGRVMGFRRKTPKRDEREMFGMRFTAKLHPSPNSPSRTRVDKFLLPGSLKKGNIELVKMRNRIDFSCPKKYTHECFQCAKGTKSCPSATHLLDYVHGTCSRCNNPKAVIDPDPTSGDPSVCLDCRNT